MIISPKPWRRFGTPGNRLMKFWRAWLTNIKPVDRLALLILAVILVINITVWQVVAARREHAVEPVPGGTFTEAILAANQAEVDKQLSRLTHTGLVRFDQNHQIQGAVATAWEIKADGREYHLTLQDKFDAPSVRDQLLTQKDTLSDVAIEAPEAHKLVITLVQPFGPFLEELTKPTLPYGPFVAKKRSSREITLERNPEAAAPQVLLDRVIVSIYHDKADYERAWADRAAMGFINVKNGTTRYRHHQLVLPREMVLFFNTDRKTLLSKDLRTKLRNNENIGQNVQFTITASSVEASRTAAEDLKKRLENLGAKVELKFLDLTELEQDIIPKRDYDALLMGIDFGADPDPYPFWHSSQIGGKGRNLSQFVNKDADKLLEQARLITDPTARQEKYAAFQKVLDQEAPAIFLGKQVVDYELSTKVKGAQIGQGVTVSDRFSNVQEWHLKTKRVRK
ncbi:MAG: hypothetical protein WAP74_03410 [Patescibacteria group bacterium]